jgi:iron(III) transport system substrate-binding protein
MCRLSFELTGGRLCVWGLSLLLAAGGCAPADPGSAAPSAIQAGGNAEWDRAVAAARREGKVVISGPTRELWRQNLLTFEQDFPGIQVEYTGSNSRDFWPRLFRERELGQYLWDVRVGGPDPQVYEAKERGALDPVRPLLLLPEVTDEHWFGGRDRMFFDKEREYVLGFANFVAHMVFVNRDIVPEAELDSVRDLLDPRWKGEIVIQDPRGGAGLNALQVFMLAYGEGMLTELLTRQALVVANDVRQQAEWVIRGRYPIAIGLTPDAFLVFQEQGLALNIRPLKDGGRSISTGTAGIQLLNRAPHPNAAKVYVNWLLTRAVQARLATATKQNSRRLDVPPADPESVPDDARPDDYIVSQAEQWLPVRQRALELTNAHLR